MNRTTVAACCTVLALGGLLAVPAHAAKAKGETEFKKHCAVCHPNGGNIIKADKTLSRKDREKNGLKSATDIVTYMRSPGPGMTAFDQKALPDKEAKEIATYIITTFK